MEGITDTLQSTYDNLVGGKSGKSIFNIVDILNTDNPDNYYLYATFFITVIIFIAIALWVYTNYIEPELINPDYKPNQEWINDSSNDSSKDNDKTANIYFFETSWCPHCKSVKPIWERFKNTYNGKIVNGHTINCQEVDCEVNETLANKFDIKGYPTIKLQKGEEIIEYDAKPNIDTLKQFVNTVI